MLSSPAEAISYAVWLYFRFPLSLWNGRGNARCSRLCEIRFDDGENPRHDSLNARGVGMLSVALHQSRMAEYALQKKWIERDAMRFRKRGINRVGLADPYDVVEIIVDGPRICSAQHIVAAEFNDDQISPILERGRKALQGLRGGLSRNGAVEYEHVSGLDAHNHALTYLLARLSEFEIQSAI